MKSTARPTTKPTGAADKKTTSAHHATAGAATKKVVRPAQLPEIDEKDDYIVNLKGQVFLLTIENEMLKKFAKDEGGVSTTTSSSSQQQQQQYAGGGVSMVGAASRTGTGAAGVMHTPRSAYAAPPMPSSATTLPSVPMMTNNNHHQQNLSSLNSSSANAALLASDLPPATYPTEINDAFEVMRQKYSQVESQYQRDLDDKRRAAEALASQCAAQSSYIITLKKEVAAANDALAEQKRASQDVEQRSEADLEVAQRDISQLHDRITELNGVISDLEENKIRGLLAQVAELKTQALNATSERNGAEEARIRALESYARQFIATRMLMRKWKNSKLQVLNLGSLAARLRDEKDQLQQRFNRAEIDAAKARASEAAATAILETSNARGNQLQQELESVTSSIATLRNEVAARDANLAELDSVITDLQRKLDASQSACAKAVQHREYALRDVAKLQASLVAKTDEATTLRSEAVNAQRKEGEAKARSKALEEEIAKWHARANSLEHGGVVQEKMARELTSDVETLSQRLAESELEARTLRDELSRRPPIDVIRQLDVDNLMQRNMQAAAAMQQLLTWQEQNAHVFSSTTSSGQ